MKKTFALFAVLLAVVLTACGSGNESTDKNRDHDRSDKHSFEDLINSLKKRIDDTQPLSGWSHFQDGTAWVQYGALQTTTALIDKNGAVLWETDAEVKETGSTRDGFTYCRLAGENCDTYVILNQKGDVTFSRECDENYLILGHGDGLFLAAEHILSLDSNEWRIGAIDSTGKTVVPFKAYKTTLPLGASSAAYEYRPLNFNDNEHTCKCHYLGDGIFQLFFQNKQYTNRHITIFLNTKLQRIIYTYDTYYNGSKLSLRLMTEFEDNAATVWVREDGDITSICPFLSAGFLDQSKLIRGDWLNQLDALAFDDGLFCDRERYYDLNGTCVIDFPQYRGKYSYSCGAFVNGYAFIDIVGADGKNYISIIDKTGQTLFEPTPDFGEALWNDDKYLIARADDCLTVLDISGDVLYSVTCRCIPKITVPELGAILLGNTFDASFDEGMLGIMDFYLNLESGTVIGKHDHEDLVITRYTTGSKNESPKNTPTHEAESSLAELFPEGTWWDLYSQRCTMEVEVTGSDAVSIVIIWPDGASEATIWEFVGKWNDDTGTLTYTNGKKKTIEHLDNGKERTLDSYRDGTGFFYFESGYLYWVDQKEHAGDACRFEPPDIH